jgi:hypothetical protein
MVAECALAHEEQVGQRLADLNILFEAINAKGVGERFNHRKTLNREEWIAVIVQTVLVRNLTNDPEVHSVNAAVDNFFASLRGKLSLPHPLSSSRFPSHAMTILSIPSHLISSHLISSHRISSHLISSQVSCLATCTTTPTSSAPSTATSSPSTTTSPSTHPPSASCTRCLPST